MGWEIAERHRVPARTGRAVAVRGGQRVTIVDVDGGQVEIGSPMSETA
jgi:uncharacterized protein YcgI (DUF1989 family)